MMIPLLASHTQPVPRDAESPRLFTTNTVEGSVFFTICALVRPVLLLPLNTPNAASAPTAITSTIATIPMIVARLTARWSITRWIADWVRLGRCTGAGEGAWNATAGCCGGAAAGGTCCVGGVGCIGGGEAAWAGGAGAEATT